MERAPDWGQAYGRALALQPRQSHGTLKQKSVPDVPLFQSQLINTYIIITIYIYVYKYDRAYIETICSADIVGKNTAADSLWRRQMRL